MFHCVTLELGVPNLLEGAVVFDITSNNSQVLGVMLVLG